VVLKIERSTVLHHTKFLNTAILRGSPMALPPLDTGVSLPRCGFRILHALRTVMIGDYM